MNNRMRTDDLTERTEAAPRTVSILASRAGFEEKE